MDDQKKKLHLNTLPLIFESNLTLHYFETCKYILKNI